MASNLRVTVHFNENLGDDLPNLRSTEFSVERLEDYLANLRSTQLSVERLEDYPSPNLITSQFYLERTEDYPSPNMIVSQFCVEYISDLFEWETIDISELVMSPDPYPDLPGLAFPTGQKPTFSTNVQTHTSGRETRTPYWEDPIWEFSLTYDYLPNPTQKDADYKKIVGFFLARKGSYETFLFYMRDDQQVTDGLIGSGDGNIASYPFVKEWGAWREPVGYVDIASPYHVYVHDAHSYTASSDTVSLTHVPITLYSVTDTNDGTVLTQTASPTPGADEYYLASSTSIIINHSRNAHIISVDTYYEAIAGTDYSIGLPNVLAFNNAPLPGAVITATFRYAYICRFKDDVADFEQFMDKLYEFDTVDLRSVPS